MKNPKESEIMNKYIDYEPLRLELLHFSEYLFFDEEKEGISCPIAIQKLQKEKEKDDEAAKQKYVIAFIISEGKIVKIFDERLDKFDIELFNAYMYDKKELKVIVYLFDTKIGKEYKAYKQCLGEVSSANSIFSEIKKFSVKHVGFVVTWMGIIFSALFTYFVYLGLIAYGVVPQFATGIHELTFLVSFMFLAIVVWIFFIFLFLQLVIRLFIPLPKDLLIFGIGIFLFPVIYIGIPIITLSVFINDFSKHLWRSHYINVKYVYQNLYSGYPKILIDNSKDKNNTYYVPFEAKGYYYVYNIQDVKKRYFADLNKTQIQQTLCKKKNLRYEFMQTYIIDNPYIKAKYQNKRFSIDDKNVTIEEFNRTKMIAIYDINSSLCDGKIKF